MRRGWYAGVGRPRCAAQQPATRASSEPVTAGISPAEPAQVTINNRYLYTCAAEATRRARPDSGY